MKVLVTGANGFIGTPLCKSFSEMQYDVIPVVRRPSAIPNSRILEYNNDAKWMECLEGCDSIVHLAGRAHVMQDPATDPYKAFHVANVEATLKLAYRAVKAGVRRLLFISTIKVNGEYTLPGTRFTPNDVPAPDNDSYALSKLEAEQALWEVSTKSGLEIVIIRPPLVYGPRVKGNFLSLMHWIEKGLPLPLGAIHNKRSLVGLDNLIDLIITCNDHPSAANQTFLVSDNQDLSTTELLQHLGIALNKPTRLLPLPPLILDWGLTALGKKSIAQRLLSNLQVEITKTEELLSWSPPVSIDEGLRTTVEWYLSHR
jgi:nucleoside-diphosphate-sugar epimerase